MAKIQELLQGRDEKIDYGEIALKFPWILEKKQNCILSPDSDGFLCGLFMSHFLDWKIKGFYDGKVMVLEKGILPSECIFLDMEIFRKDIKSVGHHMVLYNKNSRPENWSNFDNCIQPNNLRDYDGYKTFRLKYPLATIHFLIGIIGSKITFKVPETAIPALFFTDGTFNVLFKYPENVLNWLNYLRANEESNPLKDVFENEKYSVFSLMKAMDEFFRKRDEISIKNERGDRLKISNTDGSTHNIHSTNDGYAINKDAVGRIEQFMKILAQLTGWSYVRDSWAWAGLDLYKFTKRDFQRDKSRVNNHNYKELIHKNPLSWAMTSGKNIEYTLEEPDIMT
ncbi:MAG: hypothetical protein KAI59_03815 [Planctomycetes bacterium]|nr:hypothetical protein [Planctomycetota bacterium]